MNLNVITRLPLIKVLAAFVQNNSYEYHKIHYFSNEQLRLWLQKLPLDPRESEPVATKKCFAPQWSLGFYDGLYRLFIYLYFFWGEFAPSLCKY